MPSGPVSLWVLDDLGNLGTPDTVMLKSCMGLYRINRRIIFIEDFLELFSTFALSFVFVISLPSTLRGPTLDESFLYAF